MFSQLGLLKARYLKALAETLFATGAALIGHSTCADSVTD